MILDEIAAATRLRVEQLQRIKDLKLDLTLRVYLKITVGFVLVCREMG